MIAINELPPKGTYLIHVHIPYKGMKHYLGRSENLPLRIKRHKSGRGSKWLAFMKARGNAWDVVRVWSDSSAQMEFWLKAKKKNSELCPICNPENWDKRGVERPETVKINWSRLHGKKVEASNVF